LNFYGRLEGLGALGHGDRRAGAAKDLSQFNFNNRYGEKSVTTLLEIANGSRSPLLRPEIGYSNFFECMTTGFRSVGLLHGETAASCTVSRFLNRILGLPVKLQNDIFNHFSKIVSAMVVVSKKLGRYDLGILGIPNSRNILRLALFR